MKGKVWNITDKAALLAAAAEIVSGLSPRSDETATVLALSGDLGAGKTAFTQALGASLGVTEPISSPTFVIMKRYAVPTGVYSSLIHIDAYRLETPEELAKLGLAEWLRESGSLIVVEWADKVSALLPPDCLRLSFEFAGDTRTLTLV